MWGGDIKCYLQTRAVVPADSWSIICPKYDSGNSVETRIDPDSLFLADSSQIKGWKFGAVKQRWNLLLRLRWYWPDCDMRFCWVCVVIVLRGQNGWLSYAYIWAYNHIFMGSSLLGWNRRMKIAIGSAEGICVRIEHYQPNFLALFAFHCTDHQFGRSYLHHDATRSSLSNKLLNQMLLHSVVSVSLITESPNLSPK